MRTPKEIVEAGMPAGACSGCAGSRRVPLMQVESVRIRGPFFSSGHSRYAGSFSLRLAFFGGCRVLFQTELDAIVHSTRDVDRLVHGVP